MALEEIVRPFVSAPFGPGKQGTVSAPGVVPYVVVFVGGLLPSTGAP